MLAACAITLEYSSVIGYPYLCGVILYCDVPQFTGPPVLTKRSKPKDVTAWLEYKGFSKM